MTLAGLLALALIACALLVQTHATWCTACRRPFGIFNARCWSCWRAARQDRRACGSMNYSSYRAWRMKQDAKRRGGR